MSKADNVVDINGLILKVRDGDQQAFLVLLEKYRPLIETLVSRFESDALTKSMSEDLLQEATLVFYNAILTYDEKRSEVEFGLYARVCIYNALVSQMRIINKRRVEQPMISDEEYLERETETSPADEFVKQEDLRALYAVIRENLSDYEYRIWHNYTMGKTANEIARIVGKSTKSVNNAIYRIRQKLRALLS